MVSYLRDTRNGVIYEADDVLKEDSNLEEVTKAEAFPEGSAPKRKGKAKKSLDLNTVITSDTPS